MLQTVPVRQGRLARSAAIKIFTAPYERRTNVAIQAWRLTETTLTAMTGTGSEVQAALALSTTTRLHSRSSSPTAAPRTSMPNSTERPCRVVNPFARFSLSRRRSGANSTPDRRCWRLPPPPHAPETRAGRNAVVARKPARVRTRSGRVSLERLGGTTCSSRLTGLRRRCSGRTQMSPMPCTPSG